jgi:hypothetical protein
LKLRPWELEQYSLSEFFNALHGHNQVNAEGWAQARLVAYYALLPHVKKNKKLTMGDILQLPLFDKGSGIEITSTAVAKAYRLTEEEIKQWKAGTWVPPDERKKE